jgi:hypothetical protein
MGVGRGVRQVAGAQWQLALRTPVIAANPYMDSRCYQRLSADHEHIKLEISQPGASAAFNEAALPTCMAYTGPLLLIRATRRWAYPRASSMAWCVFMITQPISRVAINVAGPGRPAQPPGSKRYQSWGCNPEQAFGPSDCFDQAFLSKALQMEVASETIQRDGMRGEDGVTGQAPHSIDKAVHHRLRWLTLSYAWSVLANANRYALVSGSFGQLVTISDRD